ncbi:MAG: hypothetical protein COA78_12160 [Blastopirellula sp.]|nr:MAG: hypothetical protein COA78_12160 [Blastopirellula sp.]
MRFQLAKPEFDYLPFQGGYDTETRPWNVKGGKLREAQNYEVGINNQGYIDIQGYEIFDGQAAPSSAGYSILDVTITGEFSVADTITQLTSGATAVVLAVVTSETPNYLVITKITGTFDATNDLQVSASTEGTSLSLAGASAASTPNLHSQYNNLAADEFRSDISAVPGSGAILGIYMLDDVWYAFRNNAGATAADLYKSTSSGWSQVALGRELSFTSGGTYVIAEGDTITGATSSATAVITRIALESGSFSGGDAAGRLIFASQTGTFQSENLNVGGNLNVSTIAGDSSAITLVAGGRYEFVRDNFGGEAGTLKIYGCDSVNRGFEFDGTVFVPINTTMTTDKPTHVIVHARHLFFAFAGSAQHSGTGTPYIFSPIFGASELATGDIITGFMTEPGSEGNDTLGIYNRNRISVLYGTSTSDWTLTKYRKETGAFAHSIQQMEQTMYIDDRGITTFSTVQAFGNFQQATVSRHIQSFINAKARLVNASCIARTKNQFRLFFSDKTGLYVTTEGTKVVGLMPILFNDKVECIASLERNDGIEEIIFGSSDGKVYQLDKGTSFDGDNIEAFMKLHYAFSKSIRWIKNYLDLTIEAEGDGYSEFNLSTELGYNSTNISQPSSQNLVLDFRATVWDSFVWDSFVWDGVSLSPASTKIEGSAENISITIRKNSDHFLPIHLTGVMLRYAFRRQLR